MGILRGGRALTCLEKDRDYDRREFYDAEGALQRVTSDEDDDGTFEQRLFYGPGAQLERLEKDANGDGQARPVGALQGRQR